MSHPVDMFPPDSHDADQAGRICANLRQAERQRSVAARTPPDVRGWSREQLESLSPPVKRALCSIFDIQVHDSATGAFMVSKLLAAKVLTKDHPRDALLEEFRQRRIRAWTDQNAEQARVHEVFQQQRISIQQGSDAVAAAVESAAAQEDAFTREAECAEFTRKLQALEALGLQMDPQHYAALKSALEGIISSNLCAAEHGTAALVTGQLPQDAVRVVELMLEAFKTRHTTNGFCQEEGVESGCVCACMCPVCAIFLLASADCTPSHRRRASPGSRRTLPAFWTLDGPSQDSAPKSVQKSSGSCVR
jgi:hypothetical protein